jgi:hypothetical protein
MEHSSTTTSFAFATVLVRLSEKAGCMAPVSSSAFSPRGR